jgi:hypothetical protein
VPGRPRKISTIEEFHRALEAEAAEKELRRYQGMNRRVTRHVAAGKSFRHDSAGATPATEKSTATDRNSVLAIIGAITSQVVLLTAACYYFGWVYTHRFFEYFGVDTNLLGYGTTDYVLRSITVAFNPFIYLVFVALALFGFHHVIIAPALMTTKFGPPSRLSGATITPNPFGNYRSARNGLGRAAGMVISCARRRPGLSDIRWIIGTLRAGAVLLVLATVAGEIFPKQYGAPLGLFLPFFLMLGVGLLGYVSHIRSTYPDVFAATTPSWSGPLSRLYTVVLLMGGLVAALWTVSIYAAQVGTRLAITTAAELPSRPGVLVYSVERIAVSGPGITSSSISQPGEKYHFQYTGLRFLGRGPDKLLLAPAKWQHGRDRVFLVRDDDSVRIDIQAW